MRLWKSYLDSIAQSFLICEVRTIMVHLSEHVDNANKAFAQYVMHIQSSVSLSHYIINNNNNLIIKPYIKCLIFKPKIMWRYLFNYTYMEFDQIALPETYLES